MVRVEKAMAVAAVMWVAAVMGCTPGMYEMLNRTTEDPWPEKPEVESFVEPKTIRVRWQADAGADEYILERAKDGMALYFSEVYRGGEREYVDRGLEEEGRYIYRLYKRRGKRTFGPGGTALGVSTLVCRDAYEPNGRKEEALKLETIDYIGNLYYYRAYGGEEVVDEDWYYIRIPALRQASVVVNDAQVAESNAPTHFRYYEYGRDDKDVIQLKSFWIVNTELVTRDYYFKLHPAEKQYIGGNPAGGAIIKYRISIGEIVPL